MVAGTTGTHGAVAQKAVMAVFRAAREPAPIQRNLERDLTVPELAAYHSHATHSYA